MLLDKDRYLGRKIGRFFQVWQEMVGRKPLLIKGARQVGKTESVRHFARGRHANFHEINSVLREEFTQISASLKSFAQDGRFDVIASGSMLGIQ